MLEIIRKNAGSWLVKLILGAITVVFIFWGVGSFTSQRLEVVATVNGEKILVSDYRQTYNSSIERYRKMFGGQIPDSLLKQLNIKQQVLNSLINRELLRQEAAQMEIIASNQEIQDIIMHMTAFQRQGVFNNETYKQTLLNVNMSPSEYEDNVRKSIEQEKLMALLNAGIYVPEDEIKEHYMYDNQEINISYLMVSAGECLPEANATEEQISFWYEANKNQLMTKPQVQLRYILFDKNKLSADANITTEQISAYYESNAKEFNHPETRKASHILIKVPQGSDKIVEDTKKEEIEKIRKEIVSGKNFAQAAKEKSEDPGSAQRGGDLGFVKKGIMVKPFEDSLFSMKEGEISQPVRTNFGWHIIKVDKIEPPRTEPLSEAEKRITEKLKRQKAEQIVWKKANEAYDLVIELGGLEALASEQGLEVQQTPFFSSTSPPAFLGGDPATFKTLFELNEGELSSLIDVPEGVVMAEALKIKPSRVPDLKDVRERVKRSVLNENAKKLCREKAENILKEAKDQGIFKAAEKRGIKVKETGLFKRTDTTGGGKLPATVIQSAVGLFEGKLHSDSVVENGSAFYVLEFKNKKEPSMDNFQSTKKELYEKLLNNKKQTALDDWLEHKRQKSDIRMEMKL